jgi:hypothetical protein
VLDLQKPVDQNASHLVIYMWLRNEGVAGDSVLVFSHKQMVLNATQLVIGQSQFFGPWPGLLWLDRHRFILGGSKETLLDSHCIILKGALLRKIFVFILIIIVFS